MAYVDANNYYFRRFNPLEDNLRIYKVIAGDREQLASVVRIRKTSIVHTHTLASEKGTFQ